MKKGLKIVPVGRIEEVLKVALKEPLQPIVWNEEMAALANHKRELESQHNDEITTH